MLAGLEEAVHSRKPQEVRQTVAAIDSLLAGLIDYAGMFPPAGLDMRAAVRNYLSYRRSSHAAALGRFIVEFDRIDALRMLAGDDLQAMRLSVIASPNTEWDRVSAFLNDHVPIESVEVKVQSKPEIDAVCKQAPANLEKYFELPSGLIDPERLEAIGSAGGRVKLRMGGTVGEAFPSPATVAHILAAVAGYGLAFKATAGLHHPIRSRHPYAYAANSPAGWMHGFVNLICTTALIHFGGNADEAEALLDERDPGAWRLTPDGIAWRSHVWSADHLSKTREKLISFGSCSFEEPIRDLEALGWL